MRQTYYLFTYKSSCMRCVLMARLERGWWRLFVTGVSEVREGGTSSYANVSCCATLESTSAVDSISCMQMIWSYRIVVVVLEQRHHLQQHQHQ